MRDLEIEIQDLHAKNHWLHELLSKAKMENRNLKIEIEELRNQIHEIERKN